MAQSFVLIFYETTGERYYGICQNHKGESGKGAYLLCYFQQQGCTGFFQKVMASGEAGRGTGISEEQGTGQMLHRVYSSIFRQKMHGIQS